jgi:hypothetical protein
MGSFIPSYLCFDCILSDKLHRRVFLLFCTTMRLNSMTRSGALDS